MACGSFTRKSKSSRSHTTKLRLSAASFWPKLERACSRVANHDCGHAHLIMFPYECGYYSRAASIIFCELYIGVATIWDAASIRINMVRKGRVVYLVLPCCRVQRSYYISQMSGVITASTHMCTLHEMMCVAS